MKKMVKKGFTLTELIVVMAVFSIIMVAVMSLIDPVSTIYKNTAVAERTYANANSIQTYLQTHLEYAESMVVATSDNIGDHDGVITADEMKEILDEYGRAHFNYIVTAKGKDTDKKTLDEVCWTEGQIHVLRLVNNGPNRGQVLHSIYPFTSNNSSNAGFTLVGYDTVTANPEINPAFFEARDAKYNYSYALGSGKFKNVPVPTGGDADSTYKALDRDVDALGTGIRQNDLALTIVIDKAGKNNQGSKDVTVVPEGGGEGNTYRAFRCPATLQVCPISLTAINTRSNTSIGIRRPFKKDGTEAVALQQTITPEADDGCGWSFLTKRTSDDSSLVSEQVDFTEDIYFIYVYTDEMKPGTAVPTT